MAPKTTKKPVTKKIVAKKAPAKKAPVKATVPAAHECACGHDCHCGHNCHCHHGCKFSHVLKKIIVFIIIFALGFAAAKFVPCGKKHPRMPKPQFENGCLVVDSIKCPKLLEQLPVIDADANGCVTTDEFRAAKRAFHRG